LCGIVSRDTRQFGLCDCTKESVEYFCNLWFDNKRLYLITNISKRLNS
jgi:hypothetical protein